jgi:hypothetical protein
VRTLSDDRPQRDWLGHGLQVAAILVVLGLPAFIWANNTNATQAAMLARMERQDKDIADVRQVQTLMTGQNLEVIKTMTRIDTTLETLKDQARPKR